MTIFADLLNSLTGIFRLTWGTFYNMLSDGDFKSSSQCNKYRIWNEFSFHTVFMKRVVCFYISEPLARGYKTHNEFHKYRMKWKFISDSLYYMLNSQKRKKNTVLSSFITNFIVENAPTSGRYLWRHRRTATSQPIKMLPCAMS